MKKNTSRIALCGIVSALITAIMFFTGAVPIATLALPALAGCLVIPVVAEIDARWGFGVYAVCSVLSFLVSPDREAFMFYLLFFGYYPVIFGPLGKVKSKPLRMAVKLLIFNAAVVCETLVSIYIFGIPLESIGFLGAFTPWVLLVLANIVFIIYDFALRGLIATYFSKLRPKIKGILKLK